MDPLSIGDPYIEWEETNAARDPLTDYFIEERENQMEDFNLEKFKGDVAVVLIAEYDLSLDLASETVEASFNAEPHLWNENADVADLAKYLATEGDDE